MQQSLRRLPASNGHSARRRVADGDVCGHGLAFPCPTARTSPTLLRAAASRAFEDVVETVDAQVVLEAPGSGVLNGFQEHQEASDICSHLEALSLSLDAVLQETETVVEASKWDGYTLPADVKEEFVHSYRQGRKEDERAKKEARKLRRVLRDAEAAAATVAAPDVAGAPQPQQQQLQQPQSLQQQVQQHEATSMRQPLQLLGQPTSHPGQQQQQRLRSQQLEVREQPDRQRRRRSSAAAAAGAAGTDSPAAAMPGAAVPAALPAAPLPAAPSSSSSSSSAPSRRRSKPPQAHAAAAAPPAEAVTANRGGPAGPRPASGLSLSALSTAAVPQAVSGSSSHGAAPFNLALALGSPGASTSSSISSSRLGAASSRPGPSRTLRAAGMSSRSSRLQASGASAPAVPSSMSKLVDNNIHGLDMRVDLLTADQEKELAVMVQDLLQLEAFAKELTSQLGRPPTDLEWMEAAGAAAGAGEDPQAALHAFTHRLKHARQAKQVMISANYKLVVSICRKYQGYGMALGDLINEGISGLVRGVERFEPSKGCKFSTYAHWWIRQAVTRSLSEQGRLVRLPSHLQELMTKMTKISRSHEAQYGREPSLAELSRELGVDASRIRDAYEAVFTPRSLDQPVGDADGATLGDIVEDEHMLGPEDAVYIESLKHDLEGVLANLPPREAGVVRMRFGLLDGHERTLDEIGAQYNVTRERIRQIEAKAIRQLRARQLQAGSVLADYQAGEIDAKPVAARTSSGTRKQS